MSQKRRNGNSHDLNLAYDGVGNYNRKTYPLGDHSSATFDDDANANTFTDGRNNLRTYVLAADDSRVLEIHYPDASYNVTYVHDVYDRVMSMTDKTGTTTYTYDDLDNLLSTTTTYSGLGVAHAVSYTLNPDGSRATMVTPKGTQSYIYDNAGRVTRVSAPWVGGGFDYLYFDNGWLQEQKGSKFQTDFTYDAKGETTRAFTYLRNMTNMPRADYSNIRYDALGDVLSMNINIPGVGSAADASGTLAMGYDSAFNLRSETRLLSNPPSTLYDYSFTTDPAGNLTNARGASYPVNANNQVTGTGFAYDNDGNPTTYAGNGLTEDFESRTIAIPGVLSQQFRGDGLRGWKLGASNQTLYYFYDGDQAVCSIDQAGQLHSAFCYGPDGLAASWNGMTNPVAYIAFAFDPFGNPVQRHRQLDTLPADIATYDSHGYLLKDVNANTGRDLPPTDPIGPYGQWGQLTDEELKGGGASSGYPQLSSGKYYDPQSGRYLNRTNEILNEYKAEYVRNEVIAGLAGGVGGFLYDTLFNLAKWTSPVGFHLSGVVPDDWRNPFKTDDLDKLGRASAFFGHGSATAVGGIFGLGGGGAGAADASASIADSLSGVPGRFHSVEDLKILEGVEGTYEFPHSNRGNLPYVGQSGNLRQRLMTHLRLGNLRPEDLPLLRVNEVSGGKLAREIREQLRINEFDRVRAPIANIRNSIGKARQHLLPPK